MKAQILTEMKVQTNIDAADEVARRVAFIQKQLLQAKSSKLVLGISGGVDSSVAGRLCQLAVDELNIDKSIDSYEFIALRLPFGVQQDEAEAQLACEFINPSKLLTINIASAVNSIHQETINSLEQNIAINNANIDFVRGNVKARMRMLAQYEVAGLVNGLVVGTDHSAENLTGFYTKWGDGACDLAPLFGLNKRQIRKLARFLGASTDLANKVATADLEDEQPLLPDEQALGISYDDIDDFLEGKKVAPEVEKRLIKIYQATQHKRQSIPTIYSV